MWKILGALGSLLCLCACATPYVGTPYDHAQNNAVHVVGVTTSTMPKAPSAVEAAAIGNNFGLVGALVNAGIQSSREADIKKALDEDGFNAETKLQTRIAADLALQGYTVKPLNNGLREKREFMDSYPASGEPVDAYLDVVVMDYGYLSAGAFQPFRPTLSAKVRLVSAKDPTKVLMENTIAYNTMGAAPGVISLSPNPDFVFKNRADLLADPKRLEDGIADAINQTADTVAKLLK